MKGTAAILRSLSGGGSLRILVPVLLVLAATGGFLFVTSPAAAGPIDEVDDLTLPIVLEETRDEPKRVQRDVQGRGVTIQTTPTPTALVSNIGRPVIAHDSFSSDHGQAFTTGDHSAGYTLTSVTLKMRRTATQPTYNAYIYSNGSEVPGAQVGELTAPTVSQSQNFGDHKFTASGDGIDLEANTTYWFFIDSSSSTAGISARTTISDDEESGAASGWSIADKRLLRNHSATQWGTSSPDVFMLAINGYETPGPALVSAEVNGTSLVLTFDKDLDTASRTAARQFGIKFGGSGGALQRATAISINGKQVTLTVPEVRAGQVVTVSYTQPTRNPLKGTGGAEVDAIIDYAVEVNTGPAYGRLPESGKVRDAVYVTEDNGEVVENRAASADRETLWDYFYDSCSTRRSLSNAEVLHDYSQFTEIVIGTEPNTRTVEVRTQARNGWKWVWTQDPATGAVTGTRPQTLTECANHGMYQRQAFCKNYKEGQLAEGTKDNICPDDRSW